MPVYEYECKQCKREFEYQQRMADPDKTVCEACGGALERIISRTAFQLKGSGWYKDLYASSKPDAKPSEAASSDAKPAAASETPATTTTEKKESSTPSTPSTPSSGTSGSGSSSSGSSE